MNEREVKPPVCLFVCFENVNGKITPDPVYAFEQKKKAGKENM